MPSFALLCSPLLFVALLLHLDGVASHRHHQLRTGNDFDQDHDHDQHHGHHHDHHRLQEAEGDTGEGGIVCGVTEPNEQEKLQLQQEEEAWSEVNGECTMDSCPFLESQLTSEQTININVKWHVVYNSAGTAGVTASAISSSIAFLNSEFASTGFSFTLLTIDTPRYSDYLYDTTLGEENDLKVNRVGDATTLNIWSVGTVTIDNRNSCGYARFPWDYSQYGYLDGVVIAQATFVPGNTAGDCLVHEVGHW